VVHSVQKRFVEPTLALRGAKLVSHGLESWRSVIDEMQPLTEAATMTIAAKDRAR
jgi:hypothetical protein